MAEELDGRVFDANGDEVALDLAENHRRWIARLEAIPDPQLRLLETLNWLSNLARAHSFRRVDEDRAKLRSDWRRSIDEMRAIGRAFADKMVQEGPPNDVRAPNYLASLQRDTVWYCDFCGVALRAIRQGGAAALDDALAPGTKRQTIELSRMVREAEQCAAHLGTCVVIRESSMGKELDQFDGFRDAFRAKWYDLGTIMEQGGIAATRPATPPATLPELGPRDLEAWQASLVAGMTQKKIADAMNKAHPGEKWTQPRVCEAIKRAKALAEASGLADKVSATRSRAPARTLDPAAADSGQRTDGRSKYLREKARQIAEEE